MILGEQKSSRSGHDRDGDLADGQPARQRQPRAPLDANRDQIITNIVDGSPLPFRQGAAAGDSRPNGAGDRNLGRQRWNGQRPASVVFDPTAAASGSFGGTATLLAETAAANDSIATAVVTNRSFFGQIAAAQAAFCLEPDLPGMRFSEGSISGNSDADYIRSPSRPASA